MEIKYGFVPNGQDPSAWRLRRRYRLVKGGHPQITLVHYARGPPIRKSRHISTSRITFRVSDKHPHNIRIFYRSKRVDVCDV